MLDVDLEERVRELARRYLDGRAALFDHRITDGKVVDGHGDLLADDIFCLDDGPRILDCIEFDDELRYGDVLADVALPRHGPRAHRRRRPRRRASWRGTGSSRAETYPRSLADHYIAYRAHVRAKVACLRAAQGDDAAAGQAPQLLGIALRPSDAGRSRSYSSAGFRDREIHARCWPRRPARLDVSCAPTRCARISPGWGTPTAPTRAFGEGLYGPEADRGRPTASCSSGAGACSSSASPSCSTPRGPTRALPGGRCRAARETCSELVEFECAAPAELAAERLRSRGTADVSDATPAVAAAMANTADSWPSAQTIDTTTSPDVALAAIEAHVRERLGLTDH